MKARIVLSKENYLIDENLNLKIKDLCAHEEIKIIAEIYDDFNRMWHAHGIFYADSKGIVDFSTAVPLGCSYKINDPNGLLWSMALEDKNTSLPPIFMKMNTQPISMNLKLIIDEKQIDEKKLILNFIGPDIEAVHVDHKIIGKYFANKEKKSMPAVLVVGGSSGGLFWSEQMAALLSNKGYATLALNYFDHQKENLPNELLEIQVEYFKDALDWLKNRTEVDKQNISIMGISKGGELSLLLASIFPEEISSVVAYVPSSHIFEGISMNGHKRKSSWTYENLPIAYIEYPSDTCFSLTMNQNDILNIHDKAMALTSPKQLDEARIKIDQIKCPILFISGKKDKTWSSSQMCETMMDYLEHHNCPYDSKHIHFSDMGHTFFLPNLPPIIDDPSISLEDAARSNKVAWDNLVDFLDQNNKHHNR